MPAYDDLVGEMEGQKSVFVSCPVRFGRLSSSDVIHFKSKGQVCIACDGRSLSPAKCLQAPDDQILPSPAIKSLEHCLPFPREVRKSGQIHRFIKKAADAAFLIPSHFIRPLKAGTSSAFRLCPVHESPPSSQIPLTISLLTEQTFQLTTDSSHAIICLNSIVRASTYFLAVAEPPASSRSSMIEAAARAMLFYAQE
jgi:hypothetical protein